MTPTREIDRPSFPGLNAVATGIWRKFLELYEDRFQTFDYNVGVGQGIRPLATLTEEQKQLWRRLTQKRIDVVATRPGQTWLFEVDERPGARCFGQLQIYKHLAPKFIKTEPLIIGGLVCRFLGFDMFGSFRAAGDMIFKFQPGKPPSLPPAFLPSDSQTRFRLITESFEDAMP